MEYGQKEAPGSQPVEDEYDAYPGSADNPPKPKRKRLEPFKAPTHGCLIAWAQQGVLLLNASLTVRAHEPASHSNKGWETFTDAAIAAVNRNKKHVVFMLWGSHAQKKGRTIDKVILDICFHLNSSYL